MNIKSTALLVHVIRIFFPSYSRAQVIPAASLAAGPYKEPGSLVEREITVRAREITRGALNSCHFSDVRCHLSDARYYLQDVIYDYRILIIFKTSSC